MEQAVMVEPLRRPRPTPLSRLLRQACFAGTLLVWAGAGNGAPENNDKLVQFDAPKQAARPLGVEEQRYLAFGEVMYDYYSGRQFDALTQLAVNRQRGLFDEGDTDYAKLLMGQLYVTLGLPERADTLFNELLQKDLLHKTRAQTWLRKGELHYQQGETSKAIKVLESDNLEGLPQRLDSQRALMLANLHMRQGEFAGALQYLYKVPDDTRQGAYANYNMGVALIRSDKQPKGYKLLRTVMDLPAGDSEINALKDRAALAIGLSALHDEHYDTARNALRNVRTDAPFSNDALLAMGMAHYNQDKPRKALPLWLELVEHDPAHKAVQEALMMAPGAYEDLGAMPQALAGYQFAAKTYRQEMKDIGRAIRQINKGQWLEQLKPEHPSERAVPDPMASTDDYTAQQGPQMAYLYKLFASRQFSTTFTQYVQLDRLQQLLEQWSRELPALGETLAQQKSRFADALQPARAQLNNNREQQSRLQKRANKLARNLPNRPDMDQPRDVANLPQAIMWQRIQSLRERIQNPDGRPARRLQRLRGLLLCDIAKDADERRQKQQNSADRLVEQTRHAGIRTRAAEQMVRDATHRVRGSMADRFADKYQRLDRLTDKVQDGITTIKQALKNDALRVLAEKRQKLADRLADSQLAIARVQDQSVSADQPPGAQDETRQPAGPKHTETSKP